MKKTRELQNAKPTSYWHETVNLPQPEPLPNNIHTDTVVVGAGFTGSTAAYYLAEYGKKTILVEQNPGDGASFNTGGIIVPGIALFPKDLVPVIGYAKAKQIYQATLKGIRDLEQLIFEEGIAADFHLGGAIVAAVKWYHTPVLKADMRLRQGFDDITQVLSKEELAAYIFAENYAGGGIIKNAGTINPAKFLSGLQQKTIDLGGRIYRAKVHNFVQSDGKIVVDTDKGRITCSNIVIATNAFINPEKKDLAYLREKVIPIHGHIIVTEPLNDEQLEQIRLKQGTSVTDSRLEFHYSRLTEGNRMLFGGHTAYCAGAEPDDDAKQEAFQRLYKELTRVYPFLNGIQVSNAWTSPFAMTNDFMPFYGKENGRNVYFAAGYNGHGLALSTMFGRAVAEMISGQEVSNPELGLLKTDNPTENPKNISRWYNSWAVPARLSENPLAFLLYSAMTLCKIRSSKK